MNNTNNNWTVELYNAEQSEVNNLVKASSQIKANIAVTLLKHRLKNYIVEAN